MHLFKIAILSVISLSLTLLSACTNIKKPVSETLSWSTDNQGWVLMKNNEKPEERFFAIGTWHVPGYTFTKDQEADTLQCSMVIWAE